MTNMTDYRKLRLHNLTAPEFRHIWLLLFWPLFGMVFALLERGALGQHFYVVHCQLDDLIPFCEIFLIPYLFWFVYLTGMLAYTFFFDVPAFKRMMHFIILTYCTTLVIYILFPTMQELRPEHFVRDNLLTRIMARFYAFDTNTNVCPSIHVIGSVAVSVAAWNSPRFSSFGWRLAFSGITALISISTVFVKQHSALDILAAIPLCAAAAWFVAYWERRAAQKSRRGVFQTE